VFNRKFPHKIPALERFLALVLTVVEVVQTPVGGIADEVLVRDVSDRPILRAAVAAHVDILITGDKDFLEAGITTPHIITAREFVQMDEW
jgi:predicted nucleic acid-binding protein